MVKDVMWSILVWPMSLLVNWFLSGPIFCLCSDDSVVDRHPTEDKGEPQRPVCAIKDVREMFEMMASLVSSNILVPIESN